MEIAKFDTFIAFHNVKSSGTLNVMYFRIFKHVFCPFADENAIFVRLVLGIDMCCITQNKLYLFCVFTFHTMTFPYTVILIHNGHQWCVNKHILTVIFIFSEYAGTMEAGVLDSSSRVHSHELGVRCVGVRRRAMVEHHHAGP